MRPIDVGHCGHKWLAGFINVAVRICVCVLASTFVYMVDFACMKYLLLLAIMRLTRCYSLQLCYIH
jgi:hypothetical protein